MGIEAFGVSMHFVKPGVDELVREFLKSVPQIHMQNEERAASYGTTIGEYRDDLHIIEFQLLRDLASGACKLAARFSLCSYGTIDPIFVELVGKVLSRFPAEVWLMTSAIKRKPSYAPDESGLLVAALPTEIGAMRTHWQNLFGGRQGVVRPDDSFSFVGATPN
jgi:hypothetical protein